jgi:YD repeat-containing protein
LTSQRARQPRLAAPCTGEDRQHAGDLGAVLCGRLAAGAREAHLERQGRYGCELSEYNAVDPMTKVTDPLGQARTFAYDLAGNLRFANDAKGQQVESIYDDLGNLETATDSDSSLTITPDPLGGVSAVVTGGVLPSTAVGYTSDKNGNRKTMTDPQGFVTVYEYDELNRLETRNRRRTCWSVPRKSKICGASSVPPQYQEPLVVLARSPDPAFRAI